MSKATSDRTACSQCGEPYQGGKFCATCGAPVSVPEDTSVVDRTLVVPGKKRVRRKKRQPAEIQHIIAFATDIGYSHHNNQDSGTAHTLVRADGTPVSLIVVADGVSAGLNSEEASRLAVEVIVQRLQPLMEDISADLAILLDALQLAAREANHQIAARPYRSLHNADATTLTTAVCVGTRGGGVWCGDSRVYRIHDGEARRLTRDHSWAESVVSLGLMSEEEASRDPKAHMITKWLGPPDQEDPGIDTFYFDLELDDVVMCCTDGMYMYFAPPVSSEVELAGILSLQGANLDARLKRLVDLSLERGGRDNVTAAAIMAIDGKEAADETESWERTGGSEETVRFEGPVRLPLA